MGNLTKAAFLRTCPYVHNLEPLKHDKSGTRLHHLDLSEFELNPITHVVVKVITELENERWSQQYLRRFTQA